MKIMYYELIKMLIDYERRNHPETYDATKTVGGTAEMLIVILFIFLIKIISLFILILIIFFEKVGKIEGYQELTNKLQRYFFKKYLQPP